MFKVNSEQLIFDYNSLCEKHNTKTKEIEEAARAFALERGYDEKRTENFVEFVVDTENGGLREEEAATLSVLYKYIYVDSETVAEMVTGSEAILSEIGE